MGSIAKSIGEGLLKGATSELSSYGVSKVTDKVDKTVQGIKPAPEVPSQKEIVVSMSPFSNKILQFKIDSVNVPQKK